MSRSLTTRALALGLIALFHVAMFNDVAMLLCAPQSGTHVEQMESHGSDVTSTAHMSHQGMAHASPGSEPGDDEPVPAHDHGSCNFCCAHGPSGAVGSPGLALGAEAPAYRPAPVTYVALDLSPAPDLHTLPNPPPLA